jgi:hypothetical protein
MKAHYPQIVQACERSLERMLSLRCTDPDNFYRGAIDTNLDLMIEPGTGTGFIGSATALYVCEDSRFFRDARLLEYITDACEMILRASHSDGTCDFRATNFYTPATFEIIAFCRGYKNFVQFAQSAEELAARDKMVETLISLSYGCINGGFHTPNHRWVESAAMSMAYNVIRARYPEHPLLEQLIAKIEKYLAEGIDCDEYGEFTERSMGSYNPINVNAMMTLADELGKTELLEYARRNLELTFYYTEKDGTIFTRNSRRQDSGNDRQFPCHIWYFLYVWAGELMNEPRYLKFAQEMFDISVANGQGVPGVLWLYQQRPQLKQLEPDLKNVKLPDSYHVFYPNSKIVRCRKGAFSYTLLSNNPDFMHIKFGTQTMTLRMCSSFFAVAQFEPKRIEKTETGYRMTFRGHGEYKGNFDTPPETSDWFKMNHKLRPVLHSCDLDYTLDITDTDDGVSLRIRVDNTPRVPFKLEFVLPVGVRLETDQVLLDTTPNGFIAVKQGDMSVEDLSTGSKVTVRGLFAEHAYHRRMRGSVPPRSNSFAVYSTGSSPIDRQVDIHFADRAQAKPMHAPV